MASSITSPSSWFNSSSRVFAITEILENILQNFDYEALANAKSVCRRFKEVIDSSPSLQWTLQIKSISSEVVHFKYNLPKGSARWTSWKLDSTLSECLRAGYGSVQMRNPRVNHASFIHYLETSENRPLALLHPMISKLPGFENAEATFVFLPVQGMRYSPIPRTNHQFAMMVHGIDIFRFREAMNGSRNFNKKIPQLLATSFAIQPPVQNMTTAWTLGYTYPCGSDCNHAYCNPFTRSGFHNVHSFRDGLGRSKFSARDPNGVKLGKLIKMLDLSSRLLDQHLNLIKTAEEKSQIGLVTVMVTFR